MSFEPKEYYVVTYSTQDLTDARAFVLRGQSSGRRWKIVRGVSGYYGVSIGQSLKAEVAYEQLRKARADGTVDAQAFVLPPERVERVIASCNDDEAKSNAGRTAAACP